MITARGGSDRRMAQLTNGIHTYYADVPPSMGGEDAHPRPGEYLMSAFAACMNMTTRKTLKLLGAEFEEVITRVELDRDNKDDITFYYETEITGNVSEEAKRQALEAADNCDVCRMLRAPKTFLPLSKLPK